MEKQGVVNLNVNAVQSSKVSTKIQFSSLDTNSAKLIFNVTKDGAPLPLSAARAILDLRMADWSTFSNLPVKIRDAAKGVMEYTLTNEQLKHTGMAQAELSVVYENGQSMSISKFEFKIDKALRDQDVVVKAEHYIKDIEDIKNHIQSIADDVEGLDVVQITSRLEELEQTLEDGAVGVDEQARQDIQNVTEQLAENENKGIISKRPVRRPMISIIDDDGREMVVSKWEPILRAVPFKMDIGVITKNVGTISPGGAGYAPWSELERLKRDYPVDLINHTHNHEVLTTLSEQQLHDDFKTSTEILKSRGHTHDILVYPLGAENPLVRRVAREYFRSGIFTDGGYNVPPLEMFKVKRVSLMSSDEPMEDLSVYKKHIDDTIAANGWLIFMTHSQFTFFDQAKVRALIEYANTKSIEWVHAKEGLDRIGNLIDIGDNVTPNADYTVVDVDGIVHSRSLTRQFSNQFDYYSRSVHDTTSSSVLSNFPAIRRSSTIIPSTHATGFPEGKSGYLETANVQNPDYAFQMYYIFNTNNIYKRRWITASNGWGEWEQINATVQPDYKHTSRNGVLASSPLSAYPVYRKSTMIITYDVAEGFPEGRAGTLETTNAPSPDYAYQIYHVYNNDNVYKRRWTVASSSWTAWVKISAI